MVRKNGYRKIKIKGLIIFTKLCMGQNVFKFNTRYFEQTNGNAKGTFHHTELKKQPNFSNIWFRYVNDIFAIISKNFNIHNFLQKLNLNMKQLN